MTSPLHASETYCVFLSIAIVSGASGGAIGRRSVTLIELHRTGPSTSHSPHLSTMLLRELVCGILGHDEAYTYVLSDLVGVVSLDQDLALHDIGIALQFFHSRCPCGHDVSCKVAWQADQSTLREFSPRDHDDIDGGILLRTLYPDDRAPEGCVNLVFGLEPLLSGKQPAKRDAELLTLRRKGGL